jgi:hypothetical protein
VAKLFKKREIALIMSVITIMVKGRSPVDTMSAISRPIQSMDTLFIIRGYIKFVSHQQAAWSMANMFGLLRRRALVVIVVSYSKAYQVSHLGTNTSLEHIIGPRIQGTTEMGNNGLEISNLKAGMARRACFQGQNLLAGYTLKQSKYSFTASLSFAGKRLPSKNGKNCSR